MTSAQIVTAALAAYAAIVSTLSLVLALKVHRAADPKVALQREYWYTDRKLILSIHNTGRADVTIETIELYIERHEITRLSRSGNRAAIRVHEIDFIPIERWLSLPKTVTAARLASYSALSVQVENDAISLPSNYPLDELLLKFVARFPSKLSVFSELGFTARRGEAVTYLRGEPLYHFLGINPDTPMGD